MIEAASCWHEWRSRASAENLDSVAPHQRTSKQWQHRLTVHHPRRRDVWCRRRSHRWPHHPLYAWTTWSRRPHWYQQKLWLHRSRHLQQAGGLPAHGTTPSLDQKSTVKSTLALCMMLYYIHQHALTVCNANNMLNARLCVRYKFSSCYYCLEMIYLLMYAFNLCLQVKNWHYYFSQISARQW